MYGKRGTGPGISRKVRRLITKGVLPSGMALKEILEHLRVTREPNVLEAFGFLSIRHFRNGRLYNDRGLVSCRLVTQAFTQYLVDSLQDSTTYPMDAFSWHAVGTDTTAESNAQTELGTEIESRKDGTQEEGASANIYKSVATIDFTGTHAVAEHGLFTANALGTMMDRSVFSPADNVINGDSIEYTYQLTVNAET